MPLEGTLLAEGVRTVWVPSRIYHMATEDYYGRGGYRIQRRAKRPQALAKE